MGDKQSGVVMARYMKVTITLTSAKAISEGGIKLEWDWGWLERQPSLKPV